MRLFNPPAPLGGTNVKEVHVGVKFDSGTELTVDDELGNELLEKYPFLGEIDETHSPDYYDTLIKKPLHKRVWHYLTSINPFATS